MLEVTIKGTVEGNELDESFQFEELMFSGRCGKMSSFRLVCSASTRLGFLKQVINTLSPFELLLLQGEIFHDIIRKESDTEGEMASTEYRDLQEQLRNIFKPR